MDDDMRLIIFNERGLLPTISPNSLPDDIMSMYEYLLNVHLVQPNNTNFKERIKEIYFEVSSEAYESGLIDYIPSVSNISSLVNEENVEIIKNYFYEYEELVEPNIIDDLIALYFTDMVEYINDAIEETLFQLGYPISDRPNGIGYNNFYDKNQTILYSCLL